MKNSKLNEIRINNYRQGLFDNKTKNNPLSKKEKIAINKNITEMLTKNKKSYNRGAIIQKTQEDIKVLNAKKTQIISETEKSISYEIKQIASSDIEPAYRIIIEYIENNLNFLNQKYEKQDIGLFATKLKEKLEKS